MKNLKRALALILTLALLLPAAAFAAEAEFTDVPADAWYAEAVAFVYENALMQGVSASQFRPDGLLTRAQLVTILWRMAGEPVVNHILPFADVAAEMWYTEAVRWATAEKLIDVSSGSFGPNDALTREAAAVLLWRYASCSGMDVSIGEDTNILSYNDAFDVTEGCAPALQWAVGSGLLEGTPEGNLEPQGRLTRAETAALLQRLCALPLGAEDPLSLWTEDSEAARALVEYMSAITDPESPDFIPVSDRIAVFDFDGTLFCETDPNYFDYMLLCYRVLEDPDYKDKASDFEREVAEKIREQNETGKSFSELPVDHGKAVASAFAGMTVDEFNAYIQRFKQQPMPSYEGMLMGDGFYLPMVQVVEYLQANDFTVYIISGTDRLIVRGIMDGNVRDIPNRQIMGSDETLIAATQGETDGLDYFVVSEDALSLGGQFIIKNLKMNKVSVIMQEIGQQPVLSFGNSTGDGSMAQYVISNNPHRALAFMLCCDDTVRENGSESKAQKMFDLCEQYGWLPVSMKNDWTTIYGDAVTYLPGAAAAQPAA